jgi:hypothetical protein
MISFEKKIACIHCGARMTLVQVMPKLGALPELRTFRCTACGVARTTESTEDRDGLETKFRIEKSERKFFAPSISINQIKRLNWGGLRGFSIKLGLAFLFGAATVTILMLII